MPDLYIPRHAGEISIPSPREILGDRLEWKPNRKQALFLALPFSIKEGFYGGGAGSGKSDVLLVYGICHRLHENPRFKQVFLRRTFPELKKEVIPRSQDIFPKFGAKYNSTDHTWTFPRPDQFGSGFNPTGAMFFFGHCEQEKDVHQYDTMEISLFTPDEVTSLTEFIYLYIAFERNRAPKGSGLPSITRGAGMPGGVGHTFTKKRFVDPCKAGSTILVGKGGNKRIYIHATLADNEEHIDPTYAQSLEGRPEAEKKAKKYGDWSAYQGQVFDEFRDKVYPGEPENARHVIPPHEIPDWWPKLFIGDWGFAAMTYIGCYAISPSKRLYLYRELYWLKTKIEEWAPILKGFIGREQPRLIKFCQSAKADRGQEHTIQQQIETAIGRSIALSINSSGSRVAGKMMVHEYLRWQARPVIQNESPTPYNDEYAMWLLRTKGPSEYHQYIEQYKPIEPEINIPKLQIFCCDDDFHEGHPNCCPVMIDSIKACNYAEAKNDKPAEDVAEFNGDDPYDDLRYACDSAESYFDEAAEEFKRIQQQAALVQLLENNNDWTAFYRNMHRVETEGDNIAIARYRHRR